MKGEVSFGMKEIVVAVIAIIVLITLILMLTGQATKVIDSFKSTQKSINASQEECFKNPSACTLGAGILLIPRRKHVFKTG
jgi:hypothetical protein